MAEADDIRAFFAEHDTDGNGNLSQKELKSLFEKIGCPAEKVEAVTKLVVEKVGGDDKAINVEEFLSLFNGC